MERIKVKPVVFYPKGSPSAPEKETLWAEFHVAAREKYRRLLKFRDTFELDELVIVKGGFSAKEYLQFCITQDGLIQNDQNCEAACSYGGCGVETILMEILSSDFDGDKRYTRYTLPYVLSVLMVDDEKVWHKAYSRPINGDINNGGGIAVISSSFESEGKLMSTLVHELGHAFGLAHTVNRWNWDQEEGEDWLRFLCYYFLITTNSIMGYNEKNQTNETDPAKIPGCLLGDEIDALSRNKRVFPNLFFDKENDFDCPPGKVSINGVKQKCPRTDRVSRPKWLGPFHLFWCIARSETKDGGITNLNDRPKFLPGNDSGRRILQSNSFLPEYMWRAKADPGSGGWVILDVIFPIFITLDRVRVYTQFALQEKAAAIMIGREKPKKQGKAGKPPPLSPSIPGEYLGIFSSSFEFIAFDDNPQANASLTFEAATARTWRIFLKAEAGAAGLVTVRGLRFYHNGIELFPAPLHEDDLQAGQLDGLQETRLPGPPSWPELDDLLQGLPRDKQVKLLKLLVLAGQGQRRLST